MIDSDRERNRGLRLWLVLLLIAALGPWQARDLQAAGAQGPARAADASDPRSPIPERAEREPVLKALAEIHRAGYADRSAEGRRTLARTLIDYANHAKLEGVERFVVLSEAGSLAERGYDLGLGVLALRRLGEQHAVDTEADTLALARRVCGRVSATHSEDVGRATIELIEHYLVLGDHEGAEQLIDAARRPVRISRSAELQAELERIETGVTEYRRYEQALADLEDDPEDARSNLIVGTYLCFVAGEHERGLPHLARSSDGELRELASLEQSLLEAPGDLRALGDGWYALGLRRTGDVRRGALLRARQLYLDLDELSAIDQLLIESRLQEIASLVTERVTSDLAIVRVPSDLSSFGSENAPGTSARFRVTGSVNGSIWGTDEYTLDSSLAVAAVHAGLLAAGESGTVVVTLAPGRSSYRASARNGVSSRPWGSYGMGYSLAKPLRPASAAPALPQPPRQPPREPRPDPEVGARSRAQDSIVQGLTAIRDEHGVFLEQPWLTHARKSFERALAAAGSLVDREGQAHQGSVDELHNYLDEFLRALEQLIDGARLPKDQDFGRALAEQWRELDGRLSTAELKRAAARISPALTKLKKLANDAPGLGDVASADARAILPGDFAAHAGRVLDQIAVVLGNGQVGRVCGLGPLFTPAIAARQPLLDELGALRALVQNLVVEDGALLEQGQRELREALQQAIATARAMKPRANAWNEKAFGNRGDLVIAALEKLARDFDTVRSRRRAR